MMTVLLHMYWAMVDQRPIDSEKEIDTCPVTNEEATTMFDKCITWLHNLSILVSLKEIAAKKRFWQSFVIILMTINWAN